MRELDAILGSSGKKMEEQSDHLVDQAFGLLPDGCYLMTAGHNGHRCGLMVRSVQRCSEGGMLICVAAQKGHKIDPLIRDSRSFAIGILDPGDKLILRRFACTDSAPVEHRIVGEDDPFDAIETRTLLTGSPIIPRCRTWFDCEVLRRVDLESDTELFVGQVVAIWHAGEEIKIQRVADPEELD